MSEPTPPQIVYVEAPRRRGGNVLAALLSFFLPGLGQLCQGRIIAALLMVISTLFLWCFCLGWIMHIGAAIEAANHKS
jgi:TM2 domain-containing membrane protein YozV